MSMWDFKPHNALQYCCCLQALRVGDFKLILEKGPMWSTLASRPAGQTGGGPANSSGLNDWWFPSGSNPDKYKHVVTCGPTPSPDAEDFCHPEKLPCLFNVVKDPCGTSYCSVTSYALMHAVQTALVWSRRFKKRERYNA